MTGPDLHALQTRLAEHLSWWGLRHCESDRAYFQWQQEALSPDQLAALHQAVEAKQAKPQQADLDTAFYDLTADPTILPVLYSQRYELYQTVGPLIAALLSVEGPSQGTVLDFGCGVGVLTTFYAKVFPSLMVVGLDRSCASVKAAQERAQALGLSNIRFESVDIERTQVPGPFDVILSVHALVQAERELGLPSREWTTFERPREAVPQQAFEQRTGLGPRLDRLSDILAQDGRLIAFEKTRELARRIPFQRALAARGFSLTRPPLPLRYRVVEEVADDGPLYVTGRGGEPSKGHPGNEALPWDETPEERGAAITSVTELLTQVHAAAAQAPSASHAPLYENHDASAQSVWQGLPKRIVRRDQTFRAPTGAEVHVELGESDGLRYLYQATTFDQRQLVLVEPARAALLESYYAELLPKQPGA
ncbi:MAG: methyltransferase domain-containing protein [Nitrospirota bacterium]|nr:methyltransferase domain-containing protein [Nitrospirota bacterium]MDE3242779.1 methyltransferase domain-containing protein [Nitrospirota bacterium]